MAEARKYRVDFQPVGRRGPASADRSLLDAARELGVELLAICGGEGDCGRCKVQLLEGSASPLTAAEMDELTERERASGYRLACQTYPLSDLKVHVPAESLSTPQRTQVEGLEVVVAPDPPVVLYPVDMPEPTLGDLTADVERCREALASLHGIECDGADTALMRELAPNLRSWGWGAQLGVRGRELVAAFPKRARGLGLAFDLGTTKIAGYLVELASGKTLASRGAMNPQISFGEDLISRLYRVHNEPSDAARLQEIVVGALNDMAAEMRVEVGARAEEVLEAVVVANTAMHHLLLRLPTDQLAAAPYVPTVSSAVDVKAREVGLRIAPGGYLHILPNIAGYVGADHVAMILATGIWQAKGLVLALDIGTNTEICLSNRGEMTSVSAASGPAFEGAHIKYGMRAAPGAIEHVRLAGSRIEYQTIGGEPPVGICGSGILDALAQLYAGGVLQRSGRMTEHPLVRERDSMLEVPLAPRSRAEGEEREITLTQKDVREVQLAKGAIRTGIEALLADAGRSADEIDEIVIAGAFGSYIDTSSAVAIGMLPTVPVERIRQVGNAAGTGARVALVSMRQRALAAEIARRVRYIELSTVPDFATMFSDGIYLG